MQVHQCACNLCRRIIYQGDGELFGASLKPCGPAGRETEALEQASAKSTDIHLCINCLIGLRSFFDSGLMLNMFGEQTTVPRLPPQGIQTSPLS